MLCAMYDTSASGLKGWVQHYSQIVLFEILVKLLTLTFILNSFVFLSDAGCKAACYDDPKYLQKHKRGKKRAISVRERERATKHN